MDIGNLAAKLKAMGAPGDHGYGTPAGDALILAHQILAAVRNTVPTPGVKAIADERLRQIEEEGWTVEHDDSHTLGEMALAAALYALPYDATIHGERLIEQEDHIALDIALEVACGWTIKPHTDKRRRLEIAGALIAAEIDRLDRAERRFSTKVEARHD